MKTKEIKNNKKLNIKKSTIALLTGNQLGVLNGGKILIAAHTNTVPTAVSITLP